MGSNELDHVKIGKARLIFNFRNDQHGKLRTEYQENEIYKIKKVAAHKFFADENNDIYIDWAWLKLDRPL